MLRSPEARAALKVESLTATATISETVADADIVFVVVRTDAQVWSVCLGANAAIAAMKPGATLVLHTTSDPATVESIAREAAPRGIHVLDAAISGGPHDIAARTLTLWVGGHSAVLEEARAWLATYASPIVFVGAHGNGQRVKLVNNALFVAQLGLALDAVRLAGTLGIEAPAILSALQHGSGASRALAVVARAGSVEAVAARLSELMRKDVDVVREVAQRAGADLGVLGSVLDSDVIERQVLAR